MATEQGQASVSGQRATAREFLAVVFRRRWIIIGLFLVTTATVMAVALSTPVVYISTGQVLVRRGEQQGIMSPDRRIMNDWETDLGSEVETAKSWPVLQRAQRLLDAEARGGPRLKVSSGGVQVDVAGKSNVLSIAYVDGDPEVAQRACDALVRAYINYRQSEQPTYPKAFFEAETRQAQAELQRWTEMRREFANRTGTVDLPEQRRNLLALRTTYDQRRNEFKSQLAAAESERRMMELLRQRPEIDMPALGDQSLGENAVNDVKRKMLEQQTRVAELRERYQDSAPEVVNARATLDTLRALLDRELAARFEVSRARAEVLRARVAVVDRDIAAVEAQLGSMPDREARLAEMDHEIASWKSRYDELVKNSDQALINENTVPLISVYLLNPASPAAPRNSRDYVRLALAPAFSLVVGVGLAFFVDGLDLTVHTAGQAEEELQLPVLAAVTERKKNAWGPRNHRTEKRSA